MPGAKQYQGAGMKAKDLIVMGGAALAVYVLLKMAGGGQQAAPRYWVTEQGNTGYPDAARTGGRQWVSI